jgi:hypothetical protein
LFLGGEIREEDKLIYLYNRAEYYNLLLPGLEKSINDYEGLMQTKKKEIKDLSEFIQEREKKKIKGPNNKLDNLGNLNFKFVRKRRKRTF